MRIKYEYHYKLSCLSLFSYFLWFPCFFLYQYFISIELIPPVLGSYLPVVSIFLLVPLFLFNLKKFSGTNFIGVNIFLLIILYTSVCAVSYFFFKVPASDYWEVFIWTSSGVVYNVVCFLIAANLRFERSKNTHFSLLIVMSVIIFLNISDEWLFYIETPENNKEYIAGYQSYALVLFTSSLIVISSNVKDGIKLFLGVMVSAFSLYFCGARTEFVLFILSVFLFFILFNKSLSIKFRVEYLMISLVVILFFIIEFFPSYRMLNLFRLTSDYSVISRIEFFNNSLISIMESPFFGNYGDYVNYGGVGAYAHNILSVWQNLGLLGLTLYFVLFVVLWVQAIKCYQDNVIKETSEFRLFFLLLFSLTVALLLAKNYSYPLVGFLVGAYYRLMELKQSSYQNDFV